MHQYDKEFKFHFNLFSMIDDYLKIVADQGTALPEGYEDIVKEAETVRQALAQTKIPLAPSHCDPLCENFLDNGTRMWIVDWEYSGMNDPIWDLGDLSVEAGFTPEQDVEMMTAYCNGTIEPTLFARMIIYKAMCDLLWTLWALFNMATQTPLRIFGPMPPQDLKDVKN
jgi:thiamine kinase-like enzyme